MADNSGRKNNEERKEAVVEPFSVPTSGAFYMHDNRFRGKAHRGKHRRTIGGRRLQESKDDNKLGHDKFEEVNGDFNEWRRVEHRRGSRGSARGSRDREVSNNVSKNDAPMSVKGRGPRRYQPSFKNKYEAPITRNKQYRQSDNAAAGPERKQVASSSNIAFSPLYPTGSSTKDILQQREVRDIDINNSARPQLRGQRRRNNAGKNHAGRSPSLPEAAGAVNEFESASASGKHKTSLATKGSGAAQDSGKGSVC